MGVMHTSILVTLAMDEDQNTGVWISVLLILFGLVLGRIARRILQLLPALHPSLVLACLMMDVAHPVLREGIQPITRFGNAGSGK